MLPEFTTLFACTDPSARIDTVCPSKCDRPDKVVVADPS